MAEYPIVDLGCGRNKHPNANIGLDYREDTDADVIHDLSSGLPFQDASIGRIFATEVLEHVGFGLVDLMKDIHRVLKSGGDFIVQVPSPGMGPPSKNPLHKREFHPEWFWSWDPNRRDHNKWRNYTCVPFTVEQIEKKRRRMIPWRVTNVKYRLTKRLNCPDHPSVAHDR